MGVGGGGGGWEGGVENPFFYNMFLRLMAETYSVLLK